MELKFKKNEKVTKISTLILGGVLILIVIMPVKNTFDSSGDREKTQETEKDYIYYANYYEEKLKKILEQSYGEGTMEVMVRVSPEEKENSFYKEKGDTTIVEGVIVVADVADSKALSDISFAVCAFFDLPAHKVAVMLKK